MVYLFFVLIFTSMKILHSSLQLQIYSFKKCDSLLKLLLIGSWIIKFIFEVLYLFFKSLVLFATWFQFKFKLPQFKFQCFDPIFQRLDFRNFFFKHRNPLHFLPTPLHLPNTFPQPPLPLYFFPSNFANFSLHFQYFVFHFPITIFYLLELFYCGCVFSLEEGLCFWGF